MKEKPKTKGRITYSKEKNPDGTYNVLRNKLYFSIAGISMLEKDADALIKLLEKQNATSNTKDSE